MNIYVLSISNFDFSHFDDPVNPWIPFLIWHGINLNDRFPFTQERQHQKWPNLSSLLFK